MHRMTNSSKVGHFAAFICSWHLENITAYFFSYRLWQILNGHWIDSNWFFIKQAFDVCRFEDNVVDFVITKVALVEVIAGLEGSHGKSRWCVQGTWITSSSKVWHSVKVNQKMPCHGVTGYDNVMPFIIVYRPPGPDCLIWSSSPDSNFTAFHQRDSKIFERPGNITVDYSNPFPPCVLARAGLLGFQPERDREVILHRSRLNNEGLLI